MEIPDHPNRKQHSVLIDNENSMLDKLVRDYAYKNWMKVLMMNDSLEAFLFDVE